MKIYDQNLTGTSTPATGRAQETQNLNSAGTGKSPTRGVDGSGVNGSGFYGSNDSVEFSGTLSRLSRTLPSFEPTRASRIQALALEYQSGH